MYFEDKIPVFHLKKSCVRHFRQQYGGWKTRFPECTAIDESTNFLFAKPYLLTDISCNIGSSKDFVNSLIAYKTHKLSEMFHFYGFAQDVDPETFPLQDVSL